MRFFRVVCPKSHKLHYTRQLRKKRPTSLSIVRGSILVPVLELRVKLSRSFKDEETDIVVRRTVLRRERDLVEQAAVELIRPMAG